MEDLRKRFCEVASYLQRLTEPSILSEVQEAVLRKDKASFAKACRKVKIPHTYIAMLATVLFAVTIQISWPPG